MDSKGALTIFDTPGKNCPLNILTPILTLVYKKLPGGGGYKRLVRNTAFFRGEKERIG